MGRRRPAFLQADQQADRHPALHLGEAAQKDLSGTLTRLAATGYKDFELPGLYGHSAKDLRAEGDKAGVKFSSIHMGLPRACPRLADADEQPAGDRRRAGHAGHHKAVLPIPLLPDDWKPGPTCAPR
jgi:sugar phosphate isomerase/epimerase